MIECFIIHYLHRLRLCLPFTRYDFYSILNKIWLDSRTASQMACNEYSWFGGYQSDLADDSNCVSSTLTNKCKQQCKQ